MKRFNKKKIIIFSLVLFISIGFAYLSTTLNIAGLIGYKGNTWDVHFENVQVIQNIEGTERPVIGNDNLSVDFNVSLSEPSEYYEFSVDVVNDGTIDAMIDEVIKSGITSTNSDYLDFNVTYINGNNLVRKDLLAHGTKVRLDIVVEYKYETTSLAPIGTTNFSLTLKYIQAKDDANEVEIITESEENTTFVLNNIKANSLSNLKIYGNTSQTKYIGQNLYNFRDLSSTSQALNGGTTFDDDGWITMNINNSSGSNIAYSNFYTNALNIDTSKNYQVILEVKSISGTGNLKLVSDDFKQAHFKSIVLNFTNLSVNNTYVYNAVHLDGTNPILGLRTYAFFYAGQSGSITFRISVLEGTSMTAENFVYEPYVGEIPSPNPNYPQDIHSVKNNLNVNISSINLLNYNNIDYEKDNIEGRYDLAIDNDDYVYDETTGIDTRGWRYNACQWHIQLSPGEYTLTLFFKTQSTIGDNQAAIIKDDNTILKKYFIASTDRISKTFTISDYSWIGFLVKGYDGVYRVQLEKGDSSSSWSPYHNKDYSINLEDIELNSIGNNRDYIYIKDNEWYIHKATDSFTYNYQGSTRIVVTSQYNMDNLGIRYPTYLGADDINVISNRYISLPNIESDPKFMVAATNYSYVLSSHGNGNTIRIKDVRNLDIESFKEWLVGTKFYYALATHSDEKITNTTLVNQLNALLNGNLYDGTNIITVTGNDLAPNITFDYVN